MRACNDRGCFRSIESVFFSKEVRPKGSRQNLDVEKFFELLLSSHIHRRNGIEYLVSPANLAVEIGTASLQQRDRKRLLSQINKFSLLKSKEVEDIISMLNTRGVPFSRLYGIEFLGLRGHYSEDYARFRHCIGLADAVHLSSKNLGVKVSYPAPCVKQVEREERVFHPFRRTVSTGKHLLAKKVFIRGETQNNRFRLILHYLRVFPKKKKEKELVKLIKTSLVDAFCVQAEQERPSGDVISLFPDMTQRKLDRRFQNDRRGRIRFYKNLLESKSLCAPVGSDMIREAYVKHKASLCRPQEELQVVPEDYLRKLFLRGKQVGKFVKRVYNPYRTKLPNTRATVENPVHKGGARKALEGFRETTRGPRYLNMLEDATRPEPFVIGLFGPPGSGKTTTVQSLVSTLTSGFFPNYKGEVSYSRSCSSKFWDGYSGQPIVILDDFGQNLEDRSDLVEFEQLISVNRFQLEMANLEDKGRTFTSPIVIVTSNMSYGSLIRNSSAAPVVAEDMAVWRRFHLPLFVKKDDNGKTSFSQYNTRLLMESQQRSWIERHRTAKSDKYLGWQGKAILPIEYQNQFVLDEIPFQRVISLSFEKFREHTDFHENELSPSWRQTITCQSVNVRQADLLPFYEVESSPCSFARSQRDVSISQIFPKYPPYNAPVVEAIALPEPLKVRMITKAEADTKCLQPLQKALYLFLRSEKQFALTHGVTWNKNDETFEEKLEWIHRIEGEIQLIRSRSDENDLWLSGDYTAATDNFPMSVTNALVEGILSEIDHEPTKAWVRYEVSPHRIHYPELGSGLQTSGQLMGSLLSFPLLCLLNDFIVSESGFKKGKYLINGDDVVALGPLDVIETWKRNAPSVGLSLSLGKNFIDKQFCTVNSQLFWDGTVMHTGKVSCQTRYGKTLSRCYSETQFYYGSSDDIRREFIRRNLIELRKTPKSLDVPCSHGGLALGFSGRKGVDLTLAKKVYLKEYLNRFSKSLPIPGYDHIRALFVPTGFFSDKEICFGGGEDGSLSSFELLRSLDTEVDESVTQCELTHSGLQKFFCRLDSGKGSYWERLRHIPLSDYPSLGSLRGRMVYIQKGKVGFLKKRIIHLALHLLLDKIKQFDGECVDSLVEEIIHETFDDEWIRLFETDSLPIDGIIPEISEVDPEDPLEHLLPMIKESWVVKDPIPSSTFIETLMNVDDHITLDE